MDNASRAAVKRGGLRKKNWELFFAALPLMLLVILFFYVPLGGWIISVFEYRPGRALFSSTFIGLKYFKMFLTDRAVIRVLLNTVIFSGIGVLLSPFPMIFAIGLNEIRVNKLKKIFQTMTTLPNFISVIIVYSLAFAMFSTEGLFNSVLVSRGLEPSVNYLSNKDLVYVFQTFVSQWRYVGWNAIIYMAAIAGIDQELYEAARIDGAGRLRCAWNITVPGVMPTYIVLFLLSVANFVNTGFEQYFVFQNPVVYNQIEVLDLYIYKMGLKLFDYSYATAVGILKSFVSIALLTMANVIAKQVRGTSIF